MANPPKQVIPKRAGDDLYCDEVMQPLNNSELITEPTPGIFHLQQNEILLPGTRQSTFRTDLEPDDVKLVNGRLSADQLMEYIRHLQSTAFSLGLEETKQFAKTKVLQIFKARDV